jgi:murein DD-endopeptidase MepM/ murein hydrolase activator NlpD
MASGEQNVFNLGYRAPRMVSEVLAVVNVPLDDDHRGGAVIDRATRPGKALTPNATSLLWAPEGGARSTALGGGREHTESDTLAAMSRFVRIPLLFIALALPHLACSPLRRAPSVPLNAAAADGPICVDAVAKRVAQYINANDGEGLWALYSPRMAQAFPVETTVAFVQSVARAIGHVESLTTLGEDAAGRHGRYILKGQRDNRRLELHIDEGGMVSGLRVSRPEPPVERTKIALSLPFHGRWFVAWGGETLALNHHVEHGSQRRAADLNVVGRDGKSHRGDGQRNEDYYAYGREVLAVAAGTVVAVVDGVPENVPGTMNPDKASGNSITVKHDASVFSVYAHLQPSKHRVKEGDAVEQGTVLGLCGNSGNSSEPHLHFQMQDGPSFDESWGFEPVFQRVLLTRNGEAERVGEYTLRKGDLIEQ